MPGIPESVVDQVREATDIVDLISDYLTLKKRGKNFFGLCPFHPEKTPSFSVNPDRQIFHCFGCGAGGNVYTFVMRQEAMTFPEAVRHLARRAGIPIPEDTAGEETASKAREKEALYFANQFAAKFFAAQLRSDAGKEARDYLHSRGFGEEAIETFGIGYAPPGWDNLTRHARAHAVDLQLMVRAGLLKERQGGGYYDAFRHRLMFEIRDLSGRVVAFGGRKLDEADEESPKYINSPETPVYEKRRVLYGLVQARDAVREADRAIFVEGYTDVISLAMSGVRNVVATCGTSLAEEHARLIRRYTSNITLLYDSDAAGSAATLRGADILLAQGLEVSVVQLPEGHDPDSYVKEAGSDGLSRLVAQALPLLDFKLDLLSLKKDAGAKVRTEMVHSILETLARIDDGIRRALLVRELAEKLKLDERVLWEDMEGIRGKSRLRARQPKAPEAQPAKRSRADAAEEELVQLLLHDWQAAAFVFQYLDFDLLRRPQMRAVLAALYDHFQHQLYPDPSRLVHQFPDEATTRLLTAELNQEREIANPMQWAADCLAALYRRPVEEEIARLREEMRQAQQRGDEDTSRLARIQQLTMQLQQITGRAFLEAARQAAEVSDKSA